jgi:hypothetical protein
VETSAAKVVTLVVREVMSCFSSSRVVWSPMDAAAGCGGVGCGGRA